MAKSALELLDTSDTPGAKPVQAQGGVKSALSLIEPTQPVAPPVEEPLPTNVEFFGSERLPAFLSPIPEKPKPQRAFDGVVSLSQGTDKKNFLERGLNTITELLGLENVGKLSDGAKAQALVMHLANEEGVPLSKYRQSPELIEKAASSYISMATLGLAPAIKEALTGEVDYPSSDTAGYIGSALGSLGGLYSLPMKIAGLAVKPVMNFLPHAVQNEAVAARIFKGALRDSVLLGPAIGLTETGEALQQVTFSQAAGKIWDGIKSGAMMGTIFGTARGIFPKEGMETGARIFTGLIGLNAYRAAEVGGNPFTNRPMGDVLFDIALDSFFLYKGLPKNMRLEIAKDLADLNDKIDKIKNPEPPPKPDPNELGIPEESIQLAKAKIEEAKKVQVELEAKAIEDKAKAAIEAKAELEVKGDEIGKIYKGYEGKSDALAEYYKNKLTALGYGEEDIAGLTAKEGAEIVNKRIEKAKVEEVVEDQPKTSITKEDIAELGKLGYGEKDVLGMRPERAQLIITQGIKKPGTKLAATTEPIKSATELIEPAPAKPKTVLRKGRKKAVVEPKPQEPITDIDLQTGTPLPKQLSPMEHPFRDKDVKHTNETSKVFVNGIKNANIDPEVFTRYLINEMNRYLNGEEPATPVEKIRNGLSNAATNAENARHMFDRAQDFEAWKATVQEAARWARTADRLTNKRTGETQLNMMIPVDQIPEQVKKIIKYMTATVVRASDKFKSIQVGAPWEERRDILFSELYRNKEIFDATGFWLGKDGKWRYEIDDSKIETSDFSPYQPKSLSDYLTAPDLFKYVPELKDVQIQYKGNINSSGDYNPTTKIITIRRIGDRPTLIHELQHAVNDIVGSKFKGSNVQEQERLGRIQLFKQLRDAVKDSEIKKEITDLIYEAPKSNKSVHELTYDLRVKAIQKSQEDFITIEQALHDYGKTSAFENYMKDPGEMEARLASERMSMHPSNRKAIPPWETLDEMLYTEARKQGKQGFDTDRYGSASHTLYSGLDPTEATRQIIKGAKDFMAYMDKARGMKELKLGEVADKVRTELIRDFVDRSGNLRKDLLDTLGDKGYEIVQKAVLVKGASSLAAQQLKQMQKEVYDGLSRKEKQILDALILADRMADIASYKNTFKFPTSISSDGKIPDKSIGYRTLFKEVEKLTDDQVERLNNRAKAYFEWMKKPLKDLLDAELISQSEYDLLAAHNYRRLKLVDIYDKHYQTKLGKKVRTVYDSGVEALAHGRDTDIFEPSSEVMALEVFNRAYGRIFNNAANRTLLDLAREQKGNPFVAIKDTPKDRIPSGWDRIYVYEKGERKALYVSPEVSQEWITNSPEMSYKMSQFLRWTSGSAVLRTFATGIDWGFALANLPRDVMHIWYAARVFDNNEWKPLYSSVMPVYGGQMAADISGVFHDAALRGKKYQDYIKEGGGMEFLVHQGRLLQRGRHVEGGMDKVIDFLGYLGETSEIMTRLAIRDRVIKRRAAERGLSYDEAYADPKIRQEATFAARDYMDFGQGGSIAKGLDNALPYLNASIQGTRGLFRSFKDNKWESSFKLAQFAALTVGLYIANQQFNPETMKAVKNSLDTQGNLIIPLGDGFGFDDEKGQRHYPYIKIPLDPGQKFFKTFFEGATDKMLGNKVDVNGITNTLTQVSPVSISSLPPTIGAVMGYYQNKDSWNNDDIWKHTDKPSDYQLPKWFTGKEVGGSEEEFVPGQTPNAMVDIGKLTGLSPERLKYALSELFTGGSIWGWLVGQGYDAAFHGLEQEKKEQHLATILSKTPMIRRFFGVTNPYPQFKPDIEEARGEAMLKRWAENRDLDKVAQAYLFDNVGTESDVRMHIRQFRDPDTRDRLTERYQFQKDTVNLPNRAFWLSLKSITDTEARARVYVERLEKANAKEYGELMEERRIVQNTGGIFSDKFNQAVMRRRSRIE